MVRAADGVTLAYISHISNRIESRVHLLMGIGRRLVTREVTLRPLKAPSTVFGDEIDLFPILSTHFSIPGNSGLGCDWASRGRRQGQVKGIAGWKQKVQAAGVSEVRQDTSQDLQEKSLFLVHRDDAMQQAAIPA